MPVLTPDAVATLYHGFRTPILELDCGQKCAPYNGGIPFCCDTCHAVPTAYPAEWAYLENNTDLWHIWKGETPTETERLETEAGPNLVLIECLGHNKCQRDFRSFVCRAFPFYPYFDSHGSFLGLSYYWEYWERCWVISHLDRVATDYRREFIETFEKLFALLPDDGNTFASYSAENRKIFSKENRGLTLLHRDGENYIIDPFTEVLEPAKDFPKFGPYDIGGELFFDDEK